jgi:hypothetical protein
MSLVHSLKTDMSCFGSLLAGFVALTCTSLKEIYQRFDHNSFLVIKSWEKWSKARQRS